MKVQVLKTLTSAVVLQGCAARAETAPVNGLIHLSSAFPTDKVCLLQDNLPSIALYMVPAKIRGSKRSYERSDLVLMAMAQEAKRIEADTVINIIAKQCFGLFLPWRHAQPKGTGTAIKLKPDQNPIYCVALGGKQY